MGNVAELKVQIVEALTERLADLQYIHCCNFIISMDEKQSGS